MITFLKNNSGKSVDNGHQMMSTEEFKRTIENSINHFGWDASAETAVWIDAKRVDERYGVLFIAQEQTAEDNVQTADILYAASLQGKMLVAADNLINGTAALQCRIDLSEKVGLSFVYDMHNALRISQFQLEIVISMNRGLIWTVSRPEYDLDVWRKQVEEFFEKHGLHPVFSVVQVMEWPYKRE